MASFPRAQHEIRFAIQGLIGSSPAMQEVYRLTRRAAQSNASALRQRNGDSKELIAKALHRLLQRGSGPLVKGIVVH